MLIYAEGIPSERFEELRLSDAAIKLETVIF